MHEVGFNSKLLNDLKGKSRAECLEIINAEQLKNVLDMRVVAFQDDKIIITVLGEGLINFERKYQINPLEHEQSK